MSELKKWKRGYGALTILAMGLGLCLVLWPGISGEILCYVFGLVLLVAGVIQIRSYFRRGFAMLLRRYELPLGILDGILGLYFLSRPGNVLLLLPVIVGIIILVDSVFKLQSALELRQLGEGNWWSVLALALVNILLALFLLLNPFEGSMSLMVYLGISLIVEGIQGLTFLHHIVKTIRATAPIDVDYVDLT